MNEELGRKPSADPSRLHAVVVGYDSRPESLHALSVARDLAGALRAPLLVVHAIDLSDYPIDPDSIDWEAESDRTLEEERQAAYDVMSGYEHDWGYEQRRGDPVAILLEVATVSEAAMLVVGSWRRRHGHRERHAERHIDRHGAHPIAQRLIEQSQAPVLVVGYDP